MKQAIEGRRAFVGDALPDGTLHLAFLRSDRAHADILELDVGAARQVPGVLLVLVGEDLRGLGSFPSRVVPHHPDGTPIYLPEFPLLAKDRVRYVGEAVAAVIAVSTSAARDAAEAMSLGVRDRPAAATIEEALALDSVAIWPEMGGNTAFSNRIGYADATDAAFRDAAHTTRLTLRINRVTAAPLETRRALAVPEGDRVTLFAPVQAPHTLRDLLADGVFGWPRDRLRVVVPAVGGGFGMKGSPHPEYAIAVHAAVLLGRPVYWEASRSEAMVSDHQGRDALSEIELAFDPQARLVALRWHLTGALGAYLAYNGTHTLLNNRWGITGLYGVRHASVESRGVMTNAPPNAPYRGAGRPEATMTIERAMDVAAREMGIEPPRVYRRVICSTTRRPYRLCSGLHRTHPLLQRVGRSR